MPVLSRPGEKEGRLSSINATDLEAALTGDPEALDVHLALVERDILIDGHGVKIHCHCLTVDGNGRVQPRRLAEFMRNAWRITRYRARNSRQGAASPTSACEAPTLERSASG